MIAELIFKNPLTVWLRWLMKAFIILFKYNGKNIRIEYLAEISAVEFSSWNTIRKYARLRDVSLGKCSYVGRESQVYHARIGAFTCIGPDVIIGPGEHPSRDFVSSHPIFYSTQGQSNPVLVDKNLFDEFPITHIGNDVWIGARAVLKTGVRIGDGAIIAAGSVVTQDVEPFAIVGGVPAKHIRYRFEPDQIKQIQASEWWTRDLNWIRQHADSFTDIQKFTSAGKD